MASDGNRAATAYFEARVSKNGWSTQAQWFDAIDWIGDIALLTSDDGTIFEVFPSPYAPGIEVSGPLMAASTTEDLLHSDAAGMLLLLYGDIAREPLMPKRFPFFAIEEHQRIVAGLENSGASAIITAAAADSIIAGGAYPAPMIEDGDFNVPSVFMTEKEGERLLPYVGQRLTLVSESRRIAGKAANIIARINAGAIHRIVITAHIDAKKNVQGALDNGTGVATLLLLSHMLKDYRGDFCIELVALNGEDHYAVPGQVAYMNSNHDTFDTIALNINIDGVGYFEGDTAYSFFNLPENINELAVAELLGAPEACAGIEWPQGDHSMFVQSGCPAIAVTSDWLLENMATQTITHTTKDTVDLVDPDKVVACALALERFIDRLS
ncbi:M28 family peptidase [Parasphingorhabdus litoris]|uniref:M28 family peptidase n=1 Tax=Parasphingorhabdus litoris TaxID=394733 RepID=UPI001E39BC99|nr:M28 family peptidase [Parasphingorhabdus litoris]